MNHTYNIPGWLVIAVVGALLIIAMELGAFAADISWRRKFARYELRDQDTYYSIKRVGETVWFVVVHDGQWNKRTEGGISRKEALEMADRLVKEAA